MFPSAARAAPWLFVSDIHLDPLSKDPEPSRRGADTNEALLQSALAEMKRVDPSPPVVVIAGDFLGHNFDNRYVKTTMVHIATVFGATFPNAQFVLTLGNEDSACGDYELAPNAPFLRDTAAAWEPLINRHGEAPNFVKTFSHDGFYTTSLPVPGLEAVVVTDVFWSPRFRSGCGATDQDGGAEAMNDLDRALPEGAAGKKWVLMHIPPGIDAFSTVHLLHRLAVAPFLNAAPRNRLLEILSDKRRNIALAIAGHTHKFAFRIIDAGSADPLPMLMIPALSPVFRNNPMFLTVDVGADGTLREIEDHALDRGVWDVVDGPTYLGLREFTGPTLVALRARLEDDPDLRLGFAKLYDGGARSEVTKDNWRGYWCAIEAMSSTDYRHCEGQHGYSFLTDRGIVVLAFIAFVAAAIVVVAIRGVIRFRGAMSREK
jgi:sphingomyelin phosphodiesterase acid-like 3